MPYIGLGASAHSYRRGRREWNVSDIHQYMESIERGELPSEGEDIDTATHYNDLVTTALRTSDGLSLSEVEADCGRQYSDYAIRQSKKHLTQQTLRMEGDRIKFTHEGRVFTVISTSPVGRFLFLLERSLTVPTACMQYSRPSRLASAHRSALVASSNTSWVMPYRSLRSTKVMPPYPCCYMTVTSGM